MASVTSEDDDDAHYTQTPVGQKAVHLQSQPSTNGEMAEAMRR